MDAPSIGKAGELRVRSELLLKELKPAVFDQDVGADIILSSGIRIQVKTSLKPSYSKNDYSWRYSFNVRKPQFRYKKDGLYERKFTRKSYVGEIDYFVLWCVEHNAFYIIPEKKVGGKVSLCVSTKGKGSKSKYEKYKNNWEQLR